MSLSNTAFPGCVSTGAFGLPLQEADAVALLAAELNMPYCVMVMLRVPLPVNVKVPIEISVPMDWP